MATADLNFVVSDKYVPFFSAAIATLRSFDSVLRVHAYLLTDVLTGEAVALCKHFGVDIEQVPWRDGAGIVDLKRWKMTSLGRSAIRGRAALYMDSDCLVTGPPRLLYDVIAPDTIALQVDSALPLKDRYGDDSRIWSHIGGALSSRPDNTGTRLGSASGFRIYSTSVIGGAGDRFVSLMKSWQSDYLALNQGGDLPKRVADSDEFPLALRISQGGDGLQAVDISKVCREVVFHMGVVGNGPNPEVDSVRRQHLRTYATSVLEVIGSLPGDLSGPMQRAFEAWWYVLLE